LRARAREKKGMSGRKVTKKVYMYARGGTVVCGDTEMHAGDETGGKRRGHSAKQTIRAKKRTKTSREEAISPTTKESAGSKRAYTREN